MSNEMVVIPEYREESQFLPVMAVQQAVGMYKQFNEFVKSALRTGVDVATIPGCAKPSLMKAGAEKLSKFFGLSPSFEMVSKIEDWTGGEHGGIPLFSYTYRCTLYRNGVAMGMCEGSCNTWEDKFRYRNAERVCPACGQSTIIKGKKEFGGGWVCYQRKGGCGAKFDDNDASIINQEVGKVINMEPFTLVNTVQKQAQKRAFVGAVLIAVNASDYFTQDMEDMNDGEDHEQSPPVVVTPKPKAKEEKEVTPADVISAYAKYGVTVEQLDNYIGRPSSEWQTPEINVLREVYKQIKNGKKTVDETFGEQAEEEEAL